jgi:hypothetical protein
MNSDQMLKSVSSALQKEKVATGPDIWLNNLALMMPRCNQ